MVGAWNQMLQHRREHTRCKTLAPWEEADVRPTLETPRSQNQDQARYHEPIAGKDIIERENHKLITLMNVNTKILTSLTIQQYIKRTTQRRIYPKNARLVYHVTINKIQVNKYLNRHGKSIWQNPAPSHKKKENKTPNLEQKTSLTRQTPSTKSLQLTSHLLVKTEHFSFYVRNTITKMSDLVTCYSTLCQKF